MDIVGAYGDVSSESEGGEEGARERTPVELPSVTSAPDLPPPAEGALVAAAAPRGPAPRERGSGVVVANLPAREMWAAAPPPPSAGNAWNASAERTYVDDAAFGQQMHAFGAGGGKKKAKKAKKRARSRGSVVSPWELTGEMKAAAEASRSGPDEAALDDAQRAWLAAERERLRGKRAKKADGEEQEAGEAEEAEDKNKAEVAEQQQRPQERSAFHGGEETDYQGRSWTHPRGEGRGGTPARCRAPVREVQKWADFERGVSAVSFFPKTGHLLLAAGLDGAARVYGTARGARRLMRSYEGHSEAVRDACFSPDGLRFVTVSLDRHVKVWDTETGQVVSRHTSGQIPMCGRVHPRNGNECVVGQRNSHVVQWDFRADEIVQRYEEHMGPVNSVAFVDEDRRFVSSSDDKAIFAWEYSIPVVIKRISEPDMHSAPFLAEHPGGKYFASQSMDNKVYVYSATKFKKHRKKTFGGHHSAGYAAQVSFSPDGSLLASGDGDGFAHFWQWNTTKLARKVRAHAKACMGVCFHPAEPCVVATCGWDGVVKLWEK